MTLSEMEKKHDSILQKMTIDKTTFLSSTDKLDEKFVGITNDLDEKIMSVLDKIEELKKEVTKVSNNVATGENKSNVSSHLGGKVKDPLQVISQLDIKDGEKLAEFYFRVMVINNALDLQGDITGLANTLVGKVIELLYNQSNQHQVVLHVMYTEWVTFKEVHNNIVGKTFPYTLLNVYDTLMQTELYHMILKNVQE